MPAYDAVLFDFDGVLADTEPLHFACWSRAVAPMGIRLDWETYRRFGIGHTDAELARLLAGLANPPVPLHLLEAKCFAKRRLFMRKALAGPNHISASVCELIKWLRGYRLAVVTSSHRIEVEPLLERAGILARFDAIVAAGDVSRAKPAPDPYLHAAQRLLAQTPLVVEDSEAGIESARAAGFDVVHVRRPEEVGEAVRQALGVWGAGRGLPFR
jgi:beta-phosphoglucomutase